MAFGDDWLHQFPRELAFGQIVAPVLLEAFVCHPQVIGRNGRGQVVGDVDVNMMAKEFDAKGIITVDGSCQLGLRFIPGFCLTEGDMWGRVVNQGKGTHPEVVA